MTRSDVTPRPPRQPARGPLRRLLETRGLVGGHQHPNVTMRLRAADGTRLTASYLPGPASDGPAVVLLHGFAAHRRKPSYAYLADRLAESSSVLSVDLRGHGQSSGTSTLGDREVLDAEAAVAWLRTLGHPWVALVGMSMGATTSIHALWRGAPVDAAVLVSAPARFREVAEGPSLRRLQRVWESAWGRRGLRAVTGVRVVSPRNWSAPPHPFEMMAAVTVPILIVHGDDDDYFPVEDAEALVAASAAPATLWRTPDFGHAEDGITPAFVDALLTALGHVAVHGSFPTREEVGW